MKSDARFGCYRKDGGLTDEGLHDEILAGEHSTESSKQWLRDEGWSEEDIEAFIGDGTDTADQSFPVPLDPDLLQLALNAPAYIVQQIYEEQAERNKFRPQITVDSRRRRRTGRTIHIWRK